MKNKRIIIIFCVLLFVALSAVLTSVLFTVGEIEIVCASKPEYLNENLSEASLQEGLDETYLGKNIIFLNTKGLKNQVERDFPYVKVLNIERVFPKKVIVTVKERLEVYCFEKDGKFIYTDYECRVLRISDTKSDVYNGKAGQVIEIISKPVNLNAPKEGEILTFIEHGAAQFLTQLFLCTTNDEVFFRNYIKSVDMTWFFVSGSVTEIKLETGAEFKFYHTSELGEKLILHMNKLVQNDDSSLPLINRISSRCVFTRKPDGTIELDVDGKKYTIAN